MGFGPSRLEAPMMSFLDFTLDQGTNCWVFWEPRGFPRCRTFSTEVRKVLGKPDQVDHPDFVVSCLWKSGLKSRQIFDWDGRVTFRSSCCRTLGSGKTDSPWPPLLEE